MPLETGTYLRAMDDVGTCLRVQSCCERGHDYHIFVEVMQKGGIGFDPETGELVFDCGRTVDISGLITSDEKAEPDSDPPKGSENSPSNSKVQEPETPEITFEQRWELVKEIDALFAPEKEYFAHTKLVSLIVDSSLDNHSQKAILNTFTNWFVCVRVTEFKRMSNEWYDYLVKLTGIADSYIMPPEMWEANKHKIQHELDEIDAQNSYLDEDTLVPNPSDAPEYGRTRGLLGRFF